MPVSWKDLKTKKYLEPTKSFVDSVLGIQFTRSSQTHCPFHDDRHASFGMYLNKGGYIRFHCLANCQGRADWDIYDLTMRKLGCSFHEAQKKLSKFLEIKDFTFYHGRKRDLDSEENPEQEPDDPIVEADVAPLTDAHRKAMEDAASFYHDLLFSRRDKFERVFGYLQRRGLEEDTIKRFKIGFCPPLEDEEYKGRALLNKHFRSFMGNVDDFNLYYKTSLLKLLNDLTVPGYLYYRQHIDHTGHNPYGVYSDYFISRMTFPVYDLKGQIEGMIGRRLDNRGIRWLKQTGEDTFIKSKEWLYGIDKSALGIREYKTAIIVEGIFDFFAFYKISENREKPIVISTLGTAIQPSTVRLLSEFGVKHLIVAFDWDQAGIRGIQKAANEIKDLQVSYLGSLKENEDPADRLKGVLGKLSNFGIRHLQEGMKVKSQSGRPVMASFLVQRQVGKKQVQEEILLKPATAIGDTSAVAQTQKDQPRDLWYSVNSVAPLLSYRHKNAAELKKTLQQINYALAGPLKDPPPHEELNQYFRLPVKFIEDEHFLKLGDALTLHLRLAIEQQTKSRKGGIGGKIKESDSTIAKWLQTSTRTIQKYKRQLKDEGLLNIKVEGITQELSVSYFKKTKASPVVRRAG
jgi:DNA primase